MTWSPTTLRPGHRRVDEGFADRAEATIDFGGDVGVKQLLLRYAPVEKL